MATYEGLDELYRAAKAEDEAHKKLLKVAHAVIKGPLYRAMSRHDKNLGKKLNWYSTEITGHRILNDISKLKGTKYKDII